MTAADRQLRWGHEVRSGMFAGAVAGVVMALGMMAYNVWLGMSPWTMPNLIAVMWLGPEVADGSLSTATLVGVATHMATSMLMGVVALPLIDRLPGWRVLLVSLAYALGSYPLVFAVVLTWANPLMIERTELVPMTVGHAVFGLVMGAVYLRLREPGGSGSN